MLGTLFHQLTSLTCLSMLKVKISQLTLSLNQEQQLNQLSLSVCSRNFLLRNTVKKKLTNVSTQQLTAKKGAVKVEADANGWETFVVPDDIGGRFSVLTAVGLLPIAVSGADIKALMEGANAARKEYSSSKISENEAYQYAAIRNILYRKGYTTEILANYEPSLQYFAEWWKQLAGESEGKDQRGIYPTSANFSTDLHSLGQFIQEGTRNLFETVVRVDKPRKNVVIPELAEDLDGLELPPRQRC